MAPVRRKSYTVAFKLAVIEKAESLGNRAAGREFQIDERCIRRWRSEKNTTLKKMPRLKRARRTGVPAWPNLEENLNRWVKEQRQKGLAVSTVKIRMQAKRVAEDMGISNFKGGPNWCYRFMKRKKLSVRTRTTVGQKLPANWQEKKASFLKYTAEIINLQGLNEGQIINMDEVPLSFDCPSNRTVSGTGEKTVSITTTGHEKSSFTCILACAANGQKLKPLVIFKRKTIPKGDFSADVLVLANEKGWMNEEIMHQWLEEVFRKRKGAFFQPKAVLILDSMRAHLLESVKEKCKKMSTTLAVIPGGLTKVLQPLDLVVNRIFKNSMRKQWEDWMQNGLHSFTKSGHMRRATYVEIVQWVSEAWKMVKDDNIISSFRAAQLIAGRSDISSSESSDSSDNDCDDPPIDSEILALFNSDSDASSFNGFD